MELGRIDQVLKFILAAAGREDPGHGGVGPIHLVKYVYLGDMAYAEKHHGQTFTGAQWRFHHFGPWSLEVFQRIEPVVREIQPTERKVSSPKFEEDFFRWSLNDEDLFDKLEQTLPEEVTRAVRGAVHEFGDDTTSLLHFVYRTQPMLRAAPGEVLGFQPPEPEGGESIVAAAPIEDGPAPSMSKKAKERRKTAIRELRDRIQGRLAEKRAKKQIPVSFTPPRYDEVFFEGMHWLDSIAGEPVESQGGEVTFSEDIWKSPVRTAPDVS